MSRTGFVCVVLAAWLANSAAVHGEDAKTPRTDRYGDPLPLGAVARLGTVRLRHDRAVVTFAPDGKQLISCDDHGEIRVWDVATGKLLRRRCLPWQRAEHERILSVVLSPGGATALAWDHKRADLYDTATGKLRCRIPADPGGNEPLLTFSADGKMLAVQWRECGALVQELWDVMEGKKRQRLEAWRIFNVPHVAFAPDGKRLAGAGNDGYVGGLVYLWDTTTGKQIAKGSDSIFAGCLVFSPDGKTLAAGSDSPGEVWLLDAATLKEKQKLKAPDNARLGRIDRLAFSPDGRFLAGTSRDTNGRDLLLWSLDNSNKIRRLSGQFSDWIAFAPDGKTLASCGKSCCEICLWDIASGRQFQERPGHDQSVLALAVSPDGKSIASLDEDKMQLHFWDAATGKLTRTLEDEEAIPIEHFLFAPDGKKVISVCADSAIQVWDAASGAEIHRIEVDKQRRKMILYPNAVGISTDGKRVAVVTSDCGRAGTSRLLVWDLAAGKLRLQRRYRGRPEKFPELEDRDFAAFAPDGERMTVWLGDRVGIEEIDTGSLLTPLPKEVNESILFAPAGRLLVARLEQPETSPVRAKYLALIEAASGEEIVRLSCLDFAYTAFTPDSRALVVADARQLTVWDTLTGERLHEMAWPHDVLDGSGRVKVCSLAVLPDGRAATGMTEGDILLWDLNVAKWPHPPLLADRDSKKCAALWSDLAGDARKAHHAMATLTASPARAIVFLKDRLQPATRDAKRIDQLLADLDSASFEKRDSASRELHRLRYRADAALRQALQAKPSLEMRRRLEAILAEPKRPPAEALRTLRAIAVLERFGTPEARLLLDKLAGGAASPETQAAQTALQRLKQRTTLRACPIRSWRHVFNVPKNGKRQQIGTLKTCRHNLIRQALRREGSSP